MNSEEIKKNRFLSAALIFSILTSGYTDLLPENKSDSSYDNTVTITENSDTGEKTDDISSEKQQ